MKKTYVVIALILAFTMIFAACTKTTDEPATQESAQKTQEAAKATEEKAEDTQATDEVMTIKWLASSQPNEDGSWGELYMEEKFGIDIEVMRVDAENRIQQINLRMAAGEYPDYLTLDNASQVADYANKNVLAKIPMDMIEANMPQYKALAEGYDPMMFNYGMIDGSIYGVPNVQANGQYFIPTGMRADWLINLGEDVPVTIDDYTALFRRFRNDDPDGNGIKDTYATTFSLEGAPDRILPAIFGAFGVAPFYWLENDNGELQYGFTMQGTKDALMLLNQWYEEELIDPEFLTDKYRTQQNDDISYKFTSGRVGFINCYSYDDWPNDNDGQISAKWTAIYPEWQEYFNANMDDPKAAYKFRSFTDIDQITDDVPSPQFINPALPKGPEGLSGSTSWSSLRGFIVYGKQVEEDSAKMAKLLEITETMVFDEEFCVSIMYGPKDVAWEYADDGQVVFIPEFRESDQWHPAGVINGTVWCFNSTFWATPESLLYGGERLLQRYERSANYIALGDTAIDDKMLVALPSINDYPDLETNVLEYVVKAITGDVDVEATFDGKVEEWLGNGGQVLTDEANEWYSSIN